MKFDTSSLERGLLALEDKADMAIRLYAEAQAPRLQSKAQNNAPWTDRSGSARIRITGTVERTDRGFRIKLSHGVAYGVWLELAHNKRYATIAPTINHNSAQILTGLQNLLDRIK